MKRGKQQIVLAAVLAVTVGIVALVPINLRTASTDSAPDPFILIDPGHGGADGGAVAPDGTMEKEINLSIALPLRDILRVFGHTVQMTRDADVSIHDPSVTTIKQQKVSDMHNRLALYEQAMLTIGIHQNFYPVAKYSGTQLFYGTAHPASRAVAETVRQTVVSALQPNNTRELKAGTDIFLLEKTTRPAMFVECGFLSNPEEFGRLKQEQYQCTMALSIAVGVMQYEQ